MQQKQTKQIKNMSISGFKDKKGTISDMKTYKYDDIYFMLD